MELDGVPCLALELARVLEDHDPLCRVAECDDLAHQGVRECGLARPGPSSDQDVLAVMDGFEEHLLLPDGEDPSFDVVVQGIDLARALPDDEGGRRRDGRQDSLEPVTVHRELPLDDRRAAVHHRAEQRGDCPDEALDLDLREAVADLSHALPV